MLADPSGRSSLVRPDREMDQRQSDRYSRQSERVLLRQYPSGGCPAPETLSDPRGFAMFALTVVAQAELGTGGLRTWMLENLVPLLLLAVAVLLLWLGGGKGCLLYTSPSPRDRTRSRMPSSA